MKNILFSLTLLLAMTVGAALHAKGVCRQSAVAAAKMAAPIYKNFFDLNAFDETPDLISYEVTFADVLPDPNATITIEVTLSKTTCALVSNPVQR